MNLPQHQQFKNFDQRLNSPFIMNPSRFGGVAWDYENDLSSSSGWTLTGNNSYDSGNDEIDFTTPNTSATGHGYNDPLGATISDTAFIALMEIDFNALQGSDGCGVSFLFFGLSDTSGAVANSSQDGIGIEMQSDNAKSVASDGANVFNNTAGSIASAITAKKYWLLVTRQSSTLADFEMFPTSARTTADHSDLSRTIASTITGLRYMYTANKANHVGVCPAGTTTGSVERVALSDGVTSAPS